MTVPTDPMSLGMFKLNLQGVAEGHVSSRDRLIAEFQSLRARLQAAEQHCMHYYENDGHYPHDGACELPYWRDVAVLIGGAQRLQDTIDRVRELRDDWLSAPVDEERHVWGEELAAALGDAGLPNQPEPDVWNYRCGSCDAPLDQRPGSEEQFSGLCLTCLHGPLTRPRYGPVGAVDANQPEPDDQPNRCPNVLINDRCILRRHHDGRHAYYDGPLNEGTARAAVGAVGVVPEDTGDANA